MPAQLLTVVIPVYNRAHCLEQTLDSVAAQTLRPLRLIIIDNNSTDSSADIAARWADAHRADGFDIDIFSEKRPGAAAARNRGLREVATPWTLFFDSDDTMAPDHLQRIHEAVEASPDAALIGWDVSVGYSGRKPHRSPFPKKSILWNHLIHSCLATLHYTARTELFRRTGGWNEALSVWDDYELGVRLLMQSPVIRRIDGEPRVTVSPSDVSLTASTLQLCDGELPALRALDACERALREAGRDDMTRWVDLRRAEIAADLRGAGQAELSARIIGDVAARRGLWYRIIYLKHRISRRGTYFLLRGRK